MPRGLYSAGLVSSQLVFTVDPSLRGNHPIKVCGWSVLPDPLLRSLHRPTATFVYKSNCKSFRTQLPLRLPRSIFLHRTEIQDACIVSSGLNLAKEGDYAVLLDNKLGQTKFDGVVALLVLIVVQNLDKLGNIERNKIRCFAIAPTKCMSLNLAVRYEWIVNDCERKGKTEEREKAMVLP
ncbi:hypothetical protein WN944_029323 [Citrus x changshan-huyou]|uniref:Uncharacterized protein n=1 Tax=Citrus x changshan-huyou TaxID=2935761 RepID=A0AAP0Q9R0_9ROSI